MMADSPDWTFEVTFDRADSLTTTVTGDTCEEAAHAGLSLLQESHGDKTVILFHVEATSVLEFLDPQSLSTLTLSEGICPYIPARADALTEKQLSLSHDEFLDALTAE